MTPQQTSLCYFFWDNHEDVIKEVETRRNFLSTFSICEIQRSHVRPSCLSFRGMMRLMTSDTENVILLHFAHSFDVWTDFMNTIKWTCFLLMTHKSNSNSAELVITLKNSWNTEDTSRKGAFGKCLLFFLFLFTVMWFILCQIKQAF